MLTSESKESSTLWSAKAINFCFKNSFDSVVPSCSLALLARAFLSSPWAGVGFGGIAFAKDLGEELTLEDDFFSSKMTVKDALVFPLALSERFSAIDFCDVLDFRVPPPLTSDSLSWNFRFSPAFRA